jgi:aminopeptidase N
LPTELVIDFKGNEVTRLNQNGLEVPAKLVNGFLELDIANLRVGVNAVGVHYACGYNNDGSGCVSFVDVDSKQYIYTQF